MRENAVILIYVQVVSVGSVVSRSWRRRSAFLVRSLDSSLDSDDIRLFVRGIQTKISPQKNIIFPSSSLDDDDDDDAKPS